MLPIFVIVFVIIFCSSHSATLNGPKSLKQQHFSLRDVFQLSTKTFAIMTPYLAVQNAFADQKNELEYMPALEGRDYGKVISL